MTKESEFVTADDEKNEPTKTDIKNKDGLHLNVKVCLFITPGKVAVVTCKSDVLVIRL